MAGSQVEGCRKSTFYIDNLGDSTAIHNSTGSGTIYTDLRNSRIFEEKQVKHGHETVAKEVSITGYTVTQAGESIFYSKPAVADLAYTPPHILSRDSALPTRKLAKTGTVKFPRLKEFVHFHYNRVSMGHIKVRIDAERNVDKGASYGILVESSADTWVVQRNVEHLVLLDRQLHYCVFDRGYSRLDDLECLPSAAPSEERRIISKYLERFSSLTGNSINCGTVLNFFELNSSGSRLISPNTESAINIPAVAAALVTKAYHACDFDELELKEGDLVSVIDKPSASESSWWRGKKELTVGFFPSECVEIIGSRKSSNATSDTSETEQLPVLRKRDKVIAFLRQFFMHRPGESQLKSMGIVKGKVFGTDLGEYLTNSALLVPKILTCCCDVIERHGLIDGIYRLSGRATQVQKLRENFDSNMHKRFTDDDLLDIHTVSTLLKTYFRELPNPLLTYALYDPLVSCVQLRQKRKQIASLKLHISTLPPPNYRTAKYLFAHLARLSVYSKRTSMTSRNLAIVWAPNLIRYDESSESQNAFGLLQNVSLQAAVTDLLISNFDSIFGESPSKDPLSVLVRKPNVKSLSKRLVSLATARKKKGGLTRNYNSAADYMFTTGSQSLDKPASAASTMAGNVLTKSHSVSLDSVFTSSGSVHLLDNTASPSTLERNSLPYPHRSKQSGNFPRSTHGYGAQDNTELIPSLSQGTAVACVLEGRDTVASVPPDSDTLTSVPSDSNTVVSVPPDSETVASVPVDAVAKMVPTPKPRQPRKAHEYVNFRGDKPVPLKRSPPSIKRANASVKRPPILTQKPSLRPYTMCSSVPPADIAHPHAQRLTSAPQPTALHYAISNVVSSKPEESNSSTSPAAHTSGQSCNTYTNVPPPQQRTSNSNNKPSYENVQLHDDSSDSDDYDNNITGVIDSGGRPSVLYVNTHPPLTPAISPLQQVSNPTSTDDAIIGECDSNGSTESPSEEQ